jgi:hypothetical protein
MALHPRLGETSRLGQLPDHLVRLVASIPTVAYLEASDEDCVVLNGSPAREGPFAAKLCLLAHTLWCGRLPVPMRLNSQFGVELLRYRHLTLKLMLSDEDLALEAVEPMAAFPFRTRAIHRRPLPRPGAEARFEVGALALVLATRCASGQAAFVEALRARADDLAVF